MIKIGCKPRALQGLTVALVIVSCHNSPSGADPETSKPESAVELTQRQQRDVLEALATQLREFYVFPERAEEIIESLRREEESGAFRSKRGPASFSAAVTESMRRVHDDRHLMVRPVPETVAAATGYSESFSRRRGRQGNYGFAQVEILAGNIGYLRLISFSLDELFEELKPTVAAAMSFIANTHAVIVDLRGNGGGSARLPAYLASYFFGESPVHFNTFYMRPGERMLESWTSPDAPGGRLVDADLYLLIDEDTFSAAEGFAYSLKHLGRATVLGQPSAGGSHGGTMRRLAHGLEAYVPHSRSIHPVTGTDYEGQGVLPHVLVEVGDARTRAHALALRALLEEADDPTSREIWSQALQSLGAGTPRDPDN